jgi:hypothetical protein
MNPLLSWQVAMTRVDEARRSELSRDTGRRYVRPRPRLALFPRRDGS